MKKKVYLLFVCIMIMMLSLKLDIRAESVWNRHLIQTTDYQDEYEGALHLGILEMKVSSEANMERVLERAKNCVVRIRCGGYVGSGIVLALTPENIIIATNTHLMQYAANGEVTFYQGFALQGKVIGYSEQYDVAFLQISISEVPQLRLEDLCYVNTNIDYGEDVQQEVEVIQIGSVSDPAGDYYFGKVLDGQKFSPVYYTEMLQTACKADKGMSGGGVFDSRGYLLGMITGGEEGTGAEQMMEVTYSIPLPTLLQEYYVICFND